MLMSLLLLSLMVVMPWWRHWCPCNLSADDDVGGYELQDKKMAVLLVKVLTMVMTMTMIMTDMLLMTSVRQWLSWTCKVLSRTSYDAISYAADCCC